jgi:hypothetical protein
MYADEHIQAVSFPQRSMFLITTFIEILKKCVKFQRNENKAGKALVTDLATSLESAPFDWQYAP